MFTGITQYIKVHVPYSGATGYIAPDKAFFSTENKYTDIFLISLQKTHVVVLIRST